MRKLSLVLLFLCAVNFAYQEPIEELEQVLVYPMEPAVSRRSGSNIIIPSQQPEGRSSPWCSVAILCKRSMNPVCGYDDNFGYGKFDDVCHMLQVNCYWKYNFSLVPSCKPLL